MGRGGKTAGSGNANWKASRASTQFLRNRQGRRLCKARRSGDLQPCRQIALRGLSVCWFHGGSGIVARRKLSRSRKLRHGAWTAKR
jgi:hypothetical protein